MVSPSSCALETMPRPLRKATTGASIISASSRISSRASIAPLPTKIIGRLLLLISAAAALMRSGSGSGAGKRLEHLGGADVRALREHVPRHFQRHRAAAARQHFLKRARHHGGRAPGYSMRSAHFTKVRSVASWSGISCRWPRPLPRNCRRHLAGEAQHRLVAAEGGQQRRARVEHAGAGHHAEHAGLARWSAHSRTPCSRRPARAARRSP